MRVREDENIDQPVVQKFGGTSVSALNKLAEVVAGTEGQKVLVVSAFSGVTNDLQRLAETAAGRGGWQAIVDEISERHQAVMEEHDLDVDLSKNLARMAEMAQGFASLREVTPASRDAMMGLGEALSAPIVAAKLRAMGIAAEAVDAYDIVHTDNNYGEGQVDVERTYAAVRARVEEVLARGAVPVITGFRAQSAEGRDIVVGRGGSDYSASLVGAAIDARQVQIWTDVSGVKDIDPRVLIGDSELEGHARTIDKMSYDEAREGAVFGAKVLHPRTLDPAEEKGIPVRVLNTFEPQHPGTTIENMESHAIRTVTSQKGFRIIKIKASRMFGKPGYLAKIFGVFGQYGIDVQDLSTSEIGVSVSMKKTNGLPEGFLRDLEALGMNVEVIEDLAKISLIGAGVDHDPSVTRRIGAALEKGGHKVVMETRGASGVNFTFLVNEAEVNDAVKAVYREFFVQ